MRIEHWLYSVPLRLRSLFLRTRVEQDLDEELQYHLECKIEEGIARGLTPEQARYVALRAMDGLTQHKEECRDMRGINAIENALQDIRYTLRALRKSPGFTVAAVLTLALAIGANSVVFSVLNALILRPLNVPNPQSLYGIERASDKVGEESYSNYVDLRGRNRSFESLAAYNISGVGLEAGESATRAWVCEISGNYFDALGIQPHLGRLINASDEHGPNSAPYVVLSYEYWHNHYSDDRGVLGRVIRVNKHPFTIVGVAPSGFHGTLLFFHPDLFVPLFNLGPVDQNALNTRGSVFMALGHLKAGVTPAQAIADLNSIGADLAKIRPKDNGKLSFTLARPSLYGDYLGGPVRAFMTGLMLLAGLILLAACANLGSLFAARAADRSREVALRLALGSSRIRILRRLFTEALLISLLGGAVGLWGSVLLLTGLSNWQPFSRYPNFHAPVTPDATVYAVALLLTLASGFLFGAVPVRQVLRTNPYQVVKSGSSAKVGQRLTTRDMLLVVQIAICGVLVTSSMVAVRGLIRSMNDQYGFDLHHTTLVDTDLTMAGYSGDKVAPLQKRMIESLQRIPGVESVGLADSLPMGDGTSDSNVFTDSAADLRPSNAAAHSIVFKISPEYFHAAGTTLRAGRTFTWHDDQSSTRVAVVNGEFARRVFGAANAVGGYYKMPDGTRTQVVGVVEDGKYNSLTEDPQAAMFLPILQSPTASTYLVVRSIRDPLQLAPAVRSALRDVDSALPVHIQTWYREMDAPLFGPRMATIALGVMGVMGAMLSVTGIFGMAAYSVSRRLKELGIRIALGAERKEILQAALGRALKLLAFGSAAGLLLGILASRVLAAIVYQATPRDPLVLTGVVLVMLLLGLVATWIPAQRALTVDPLKLLREE